MSSGHEHRAAASPGPFQARYSPNLPELLRRLDCSLLISTYQAGKLVVVSAPDDERLIQLPRTLDRPMALARDGRRLAVSTAGAVQVYVNDDRLAENYPRQPKTYDSLFVPRIRFETGCVETHHLEWEGEALLLLSTLFSCLARIGVEHSLEPVWSPAFVSALAPEDRCHLNGVVFHDRTPRFATALGTGDEPESWRRTLPNGGVLIDVPSGETVVSGLAMPHSPLLVNGTLYALLSGTGELIRVDTEAGRYDVVKKVGGFVRGMSWHADHLFIAHSRLRKNSSTFRDLPIANDASTSGIVIIHEPSLAVVARLTYQTSVDEIFAVEPLPGMTRPGIMPESPTAQMPITLPESSYWPVQQGNDR